MHKKSWGLKNFIQQILEDEAVYLRYCKEEDIIKKQFMFLKFKGCFLARHKQLQENGSYIQLMDKIHSWIDSNIDNLSQIDIPGNLQQIPYDFQLQNNNNAERRRNFTKEKLHEAAEKYL